MDWLQGTTFEAGTLLGALAPDRLPPLFDQLELTNQSKTARPLLSTLEALLPSLLLIDTSN